MLLRAHSERCFGDWHQIEPKPPADKSRTLDLWTIINFKIEWFQRLCRTILIGYNKLGNLVITVCICYIPIPMLSILILQDSSWSSWDKFYLCQKEFSVWDWEEEGQCQELNSRTSHMQDKSCTGPRTYYMKQVWFLLGGLIQLPIFEAHLSILSLWAIGVSVSGAGRWRWS